MKSLNLRSTSRLFVLIFCFFILAVLPLASIAQAAPVRSGSVPTKGPFINYNPLAGEYPTYVSGFGCGFQSGETVNISFNGIESVLVWHGTVQSNGCFKFSFYIPDLPDCSGACLIQAFGLTSHQSASGPFTN